MGLLSSSKEVTILGVKPSTLALFEGTLAGAIGLFVAVLFGLRATIGLTQETSSVLAGLSLGLSAGVVAIIVVPLVYFAIGWVLGYLHGWVFNVIVGETRGITIYTDKK